MLPAFPVLLAGIAAGAQERSVPELYAAGEEVHWVFEQRGSRIGACGSVYAGEVDLPGLPRAHAFQSWVELVTTTPDGPLTQRSTTDLWTDAAGRPRRLAFRLSVSDVFAGIEAAFEGGRVEARVRQGPSETVQTIDVPAGSFVLANNFLGHLELAVALGTAEGGEARLPMLSVNTLRPFELALEPSDASPAEGAERVLRDSLGELLHLDGAGRLVRVEIPAQGLVLRRTSEPFARFAIEVPGVPAPAADLPREEVVVEAGEARIAGAITRPPGAAAQRLPAVLFLSGSGAQDRDGRGAGLDVGTHEILDRLTREGFLVLRVDDRGAGATVAPLDGVDYDALVADARACVRFLRARPDVDPERIVLVGHSEGGITAPILAAEEPGIAAVVLLAAPGRGVGELLVEQLSRERRRAGATETELEAFAAEVRAFLARVGAGEPVEREGLAPELQAFLPAQAWLADHVRLDPLAALARVRCPVLVLQGEEDIQVSAERDAPRLVAALAAAGHEDHELVVLSGLDHLFKRTVGERSSPLDYLKARPVDPGFLDVLVGWLRPRVLAPR